MWTAARGQKWKISILHASVCLWFIGYCAYFLITALIPSFPFLSVCLIWNSTWGLRSTFEPFYYETKCNQNLWITLRFLVLLISLKIHRVSCWYHCCWYYRAAHISTHITELSLIMLKYGILFSVLPVFQEAAAIISFKRWLFQIVHIQ